MADMPTRSFGFAGAFMRWVTISKTSLVIVAGLAILKCLPGAELMKIYLGCSCASDCKKPTINVRAINPFFKIIYQTSF
jgi:hypothetical protein